MKKLFFAIHDLNPWGGHERSTLEIARRLSHHWPTEVFAYSLTDPQGARAWGKHRLRRLRPTLSRPMIGKVTWYSLATWPWLALEARKQNALIHATGACAMVSDVVQVQFLNAAWWARKHTPGFDDAELGESAWRRLYQRINLRYNLEVEKKVYRADKTYLAISQAVADELKAHYGFEKNVHVIRHGVDAEIFHPARPESPETAARAALRDRYGVGEGERLVLFVGAYGRKGLRSAIEAFALLSPAARARAKLVAVGGGPAEDFRAQARRLGIEDRIVLAGHQKDVAAQYRAADLFLLPTYYEPFGLVILEAMASGLAPIVSRGAGAAELIDDGKNGLLLLDPRDPREIARALERLVLNDPEREAMAARALEVARARSWDQVAREYAEVLAPLMKADRQAKKGKA